MTIYKVTYECTLAHPAWTPTNMLRKAEQITGKKFRRRAYAEAVEALEGYLKEAQC